MFPFALSFSVTSMFHYLLPSTRNLYSAAGWKTGIWLDVCGLLSGIAFSTDTIDDLRFALFNERSDLEEEDDSESNEDASSATTTTTTTKPLPQSVRLSNFSNIIFSCIFSIKIFLY